MVFISYRRSFKSGNFRNSPLRFHRIFGGPGPIAEHFRVAAWFFTTKVSSGSSRNRNSGNVPEKGKKSKWYWNFENCLLLPSGKRSSGRLPLFSHLLETTRVQNHSLGENSDKRTRATIQDGPRARNLASKMVFMRFCSFIWSSDSLEKIFFWSPNADHVSFNNKNNISFPFRSLERRVWNKRKISGGVTSPSNFRKRSFPCSSFHPSSVSYPKAIRQYI